MKGFALTTYWIPYFLWVSWYSYLVGLLYRLKHLTLWICGNSLEHCVVGVLHVDGKGTGQKDFLQQSAHVTLLEFSPHQKILGSGAKWLVWASLIPTIILTLSLHLAWTDYLHVSGSASLPYWQFKHLSPSFHFVAQMELLSMKQKILKIVILKTL